MLIARLAHTVRYQAQIGLDGTMFGIIFTHEDGSETPLALPHHALPELIRQLQIAEAMLRERRERPRH